MDLGATAEVRQFCKHPGNHILSESEREVRLTKWKRDQNLYVALLGVVTFILSTTISSCPLLYQIAPVATRCYLLILSLGGLLGGIGLLMCLNAMIYYLEESSQLACLVYKVYDIGRRFWWLSFLVGMTFFNFSLLGLVFSR